MIRVLIVSQSPLLCSVSAAVLRGEADMEVIGAAASVEEALEVVQFRECDIAIVSANMPGNGAIALTRTLRTRALPLVLVIGLAKSEEAILRYIEAGAAGYVLAEATVEDLLMNVRAAHAGTALVSPEITAALFSRIAALADCLPPVGKELDGFADLTPREFEILNLIDKGYTNQEIADHLVIQVGTVKNHVHSILEKLDVESRRDAVAYWHARHNAGSASGDLAPTGSGGGILVQFEPPHIVADGGNTRMEPQRQTSRGSDV